MSKELTPLQLIERSITKKYRKELWNPFVEAVKRYELIQENDKIAVYITGGKDSMLMAKLLQMLRRITEVPYDLAFIAVDNGCDPLNRQKTESSAALLNIPITAAEPDTVDGTDDPLCTLYNKAKQLGCNKIALCHHFNDVIETTLIGMFYGSRLQAMLPKLHIKHFEGMELIRPLYCVKEEHINAWERYNSLDFIHCACRFPEHCGAIDGSKRQEIKELILRLRKDNPDIEKCIFNSIHSICLDTFPAYETKGQRRSFLEKY